MDPIEDGRGQGRYFGYVAGLLLTNLNQVAIMDIYIIPPYKGNIGIISISTFWFLKQRVVYIHQTTMGPVG